MFSKYLIGILGISLFWVVIQKKDLEQSLYKEKQEKERYQILYTKSQETVHKLDILAKQAMQRVILVQDNEKERREILEKVIVRSEKPKGIIDENTRYKVISRLNRPL